jgi:hypothetical protein
MSGAVSVAILAFGACSYVGFFGVVLALGMSPLRGLLVPMTFVLAYALSGLLGTWLLLKAFRSMCLSAESLEKRDLR